MNESNVNKIGWFASFMAIVMFSSYLDQIRLNMSGSPGSVILPVATTINCLSWVFYAYMKKKKDWPILVCNILGLMVGLVTTFTAVVYT